MVVTDLLTGQKTGDTEGWQKNKKVYNILANSGGKGNPLVG